MDEELRTIIGPGFTDFESAVQAAEELIEDAGGDVRAARSRVRSIWDARIAELATGVGPSDHDRLTGGFAVLERDHGFVTAMAAGFDKGELWDELRERRRSAGGEAWAGAGFHQQDADRLATTPATLYLLFSVFAPNPATPAHVVEAAMRSEHGRNAMAQADAGAAAAVLVEVLRDAGLEVDWDGSPSSRVRVLVSDWRRPLPAA
ncbi:hypothetical protein SAMN02800687_1414 [Curtobacterium sp. UNCCL20]|uniref:DUF6891 domain-containing protein n=1 Tax=Curtobacterium sp. UNCCL20 TaxID=1502773 RepID=UPI00089268D7|nr:hypothetical protein [Curtobacterium sp. UNCCL20]SDQ32536.1 hypothetical protein SAMN02800687_1414 [Curtobacterium sp. UNCCL20]